MGGRLCTVRNDGSDDLPRRRAVRGSSASKASPIPRFGIIRCPMVSIHGYQQKYRIHVNPLKRSSIIMTSAHVVSTHIGKSRSTNPHVI